MNWIRSRTGIQSDRSRSSAIVRQLSVKSSGPLGVSPVLVRSVCPKNSGPPTSSPMKKVGPIRLVRALQNVGAVRG